MRIVVLLLISVALHSVVGKGQSLSNSDIHKIQSNVKTLSKNLQQIERNLLVSRRNTQTIRMEIKDLQKLEAQYLGLKETLVGHLKTIDNQLENNQKLVAKLKEEEKYAKGEQIPLSRKSFSIEKSQRQRWREKAVAQYLQAQKLLHGVMGNLKDIESRKTPLDEELERWMQRTQRYETLFSKLGIRLQNLIYR